MLLPTAVDPVNATLRTSGCPLRYGPTGSPSPTTTLSTPLGRPAASNSLATSSASSGACSSGLSTTVLPAAESRGDLPDDDQQRDVPRHDGGDHAERLAAQDALGGQRPDRGAGLLELVALGQLGEVLQLADGQPEVQDAGDPDGGAVLPGLQHRELIGARGEPGGHGVEQVGALFGWLGAPHAGGVGGLGCGHGLVDVLRAALGDGGDQLVGGRTADLVVLRRVDPFAVDEQTVMRDGHRFLLASWRSARCELVAWWFRRTAAAGLSGSSGPGRGSCCGSRAAGRDPARPTATRRRR